MSEGFLFGAWPLGNSTRRRRRAEGLRHCCRRSLWEVSVLSASVAEGAPLPSRAQVQAATRIGQATGLPSGVGRLERL